MTQNLFPPLPSDDWRETRDMIHRYTKVLGKIRRASAPAQKHWWHVSLRVTAVGLTTAPIWIDNKTIEIVLDLTDHHTHIRTSDGQRQTIPLAGQSSISYCQQLKEALATLQLTIDFDDSICTNDKGVYDETAVARYWQALTQITAVFTTFKHSFRGESSPLQLWPHNFDLALLWLSGRLIPDQDPANPEYADEQMNFGFVTGDESIAEPYFYATAYPTPPDFTTQALPAPAYWHTAGWTGAVLPYAALVNRDNPQAFLLSFLQTAHQAGRQFMVAQ